ncbi:PGF-CTERM-anchored ABC transporter substrate-binding protein [Halobacterium rubrum]|uniref:PGF-CTERM-anchored ABC transporter substrate-binding protein n=1 Tax=Halobacterium TaxID=2239 RepID=UPI00235188A1|nr:MULTISPECIES: PGF-CTERM-anchored ABC transporter substrate-binding protein [Halobacterium]MDH5021262.1 PGF-CTERM-anchored ABC transporter substrate-binding protein [Halobacterium rubrum]
MRRSTIAVGIVLLLLASAAAPAGALAAPAAQEETLTCEFPTTMTDASGADVTVDAEPERVVTLNPSAAQTMWEFGAEDKVVGVSQFGTYLEGASDREVVTSGYPSQVSVEQVISLEPGLVLAPNTISNDSVTQLRDAGITVYRLPFASSLDSVIEKTETIGQLTGECDAAGDTVSEMQTTIDTVRGAVDGEDEPRVLWGTGAGYSAGPNTFIGQAIDVAGGHNIVADANSSRAYPQLSEEFIAEQDPEFVVVGVAPEQLGNEPTSYIPEDSVVRNTTAFEEGNIVVVDNNHISQPAPRIVEPMTQMAEAFHPEAYADATATTTTTTADSTTTTTTTTTTESSTTTAAATTTAADDGDGSSNGSAPGFGVATGVVAVLGAALLARRT